MSESTPTGTLISPTLKAGLNASGSNLHEDLSSLITMVSPADTPLLSAFKRGSATQTKHEWIEDVLASPATNKHLEGSDAINDALAARTRLDNECQIFRKTIQVSDTTQAVDVVGVDNEYAYQSQKKLKELALDIEYALLVSEKQARSASTEGELGGVKAAITTEAWDLEAEPFTEDALNDAIEGAWQNGGNVTKVFCSSHDKRAISGFAGPNSTYRTQPVREDRRLINTVDVYESDFGTVEIHPHRLISYSDTASKNYLLVLDMQYWTTAWLRPIKHSDLAKTGSSKRGMFEGELTLEARAEKASAKVHNYKDAAVAS